MASAFFEACASNALATVFVDYLVKPTVRHIGYVFRFDKIFKDLQEQTKQLTTKQESVEKDVKEAKNLIQEIDKEVEDWQKDAHKVQQDIQSLEVKRLENKRCCFTWCPNLSWRYRLSKQAAEKDLAISELMNKSGFQQVGHPADLPGLRFLPSKDFLTSTSADLAESQIMEALKDDGVNIIGVWGMGGIGKTTLVNEVGRKVKESKLFREVVNAVVSQNQNIEKIQDKIAELLKSKLDNKSEAGKAEQLWVRLQNEKSILIILDDLWKELDLKAVGIPIGEHHKGCKILLTTRSQKVCSDMGSGRVIKLDGLNKEEAWKLFKMSAALDDDSTSPGILKVAAEVAEECNGLPIAISTLGKALKDASISGWRDACRKLRSSRLPDIACVEADKNAYKCLKLSYDYLRSKETKICFLLCSIYPEDFSIPVEELVRHVRGLKIFQGSKTIQDARDTVYAELDHLKASCLLLDDGQNFIKMHDMVRDVALWIASQKENHVVIKSEVGATEWPGNESLEAYTAISFMECKLKELPMGLEYPKLELLSFTAKDTEETVTISDASLEGMKSLKVLNLGLNGSLSNDALHFLTNLRTLYLEFCKLNTYSISSLGALKKLEILSFYGSDIAVLPDEVGDLKSLRLLDLSCCERLKRIPPNLIQRLSQLEELYFGGCGFDEWLIEETDAKVDAEVKNASLLELNKLSQLAILVLSVGDVESLPKNFVFPKLQNYSIAIESGTEEVYPSKRCLKVNNLASFKALKNLFGDVELLELGKIANCQNIVPSLDQGGFKSLSILKARSCEDMECLVDARNQLVPVAFSNLLVLEIKDMNCFERLSNGLPPNGFLTKLESLEIERCHKVKSLFPSSVTQSLLQLQSLKIAYCEMLEQTFEEIEGANQGLQKLQSLTVTHCNSLKSLFPPSVAQNLMQLKSLEIGDCNMLEQILEEIQIEVANEVLPKLQSLKVTQCNGLKSLFPPSVAENLVQLESLEIGDCHTLEQIFELMKGGKGEILSTTHVQPSYFLPKLKTLRIKGCSKLNLEGLIDTRKQHLPGIALSNLEGLVLADMTCLKWLCNGESPLPQGFLQKLQTLKIKRCSSITSFPRSFPQYLVQLKELEIKECHMLEQLLMEADCDHSPCLQELNSLQIRKCRKLEYIFPSSLGENLNLPKLEGLYLFDLDELKEVFAPRQGRDGNDVLLKLPSLRHLSIAECPKLRPFSVSSQLQMIHIDFMGMKSNNAVVGQWKQNSPNMEYAVIGNNAEEMFPLLQDGNILSNLRHLQVKNLPELRVIWRSPNQLVTLQNLQQMYLYDCKRLRYVFSPMLAPNLPKLWRLTIEGCEELEEIVDTSSSSSSSTSQDRDLQPFISFPNLFHVEIKGCNSLKYVFPTSILPHLQQLYWISISEASKLEQVFGFEDKADAKDHHHHHQEEAKRVELPRLNDLFLKELPSLISFSYVDYNILFSSLTKLKVTNCPHMTTTFTINDSQLCALAQPQMQASQQIEDSVDAQVTTWPRGSNIEWTKT